MVNRLHGFQRLLTVKQKMLDLRKNELALVQSELNFVQRQQEQIKAQESSEREKAGHFTGTTFTMMAFLKHNAEKMLKLENQKRNIIPKIDYLQAELRKMFEEVKVIESYYNKLLFEKKKNLSRLEQEQLDEIAQRFLQHQGLKYN